MSGLGDKLKALRRQKNLTQNHLARLAEVTPGQISQYESGRNKIGVTNLKKIAAALDCAMTDIDDRYEVKNENTEKTSANNQGHRFLVDEMLLFIVDSWGNLPTATRAKMVAIVTEANEQVDRRRERKKIDQK